MDQKKNFTPDITVKMNNSLNMKKLKGIDHLFVNDMSFSKASEALRDLLKSEMEKEKSL